MIKMGKDKYLLKTNHAAGLQSLQTLMDDRVFHLITQIPAEYDFGTRAWEASVEYWLKTNLKTAPDYDVVPFVKQRFKFYSMQGRTTYDPYV